MFGNFSPRRMQSMSEVDDVGLLERARRGDTEAFSRLFALHQRAIFRYGSHMCGPDAGDDIVQETFLAVLGRAGRYDATRGSVIAYLFGIARHLVLKRLAARYETAFDEEPDGSGLNAGVASGQTDALDELTRAETIESVRAAVQSLPPVYREVVVLCEFQEMDYTAAAGILQCPIGTVRSRLHRARTLLATKLAATHPIAAMRRI